jgi:hypothetical protein
MRFVLAAAAAVAVVTGALAVTAGARVATPGRQPGPECGGTLWRLMTLSDARRKSVVWSPSPTTVPAIAKLASPAKISAARSTFFQRHVWKLRAVIERYRVASNGELVLELFDVPSSTYMNAYLPAAVCLPSIARGRTQMLAARQSFMSECPAPKTQWQLLGATAEMAGVGFWNPVKTTMGALKNGAELRPLVSLKITQGCGHF